MDSLTQAVLGASVGYAIGGRQLGRKAALWGLTLGTLPDLDVLVPHADPIDNFIKHRSWSHSLFVQSFAAVPLGWAIAKIHKLDKALTLRMIVMAWMVLITHALLDSLTTYGTQIFWPLTTYPVGIGSVAIVDPAYTVPLLVASLWALIGGKRDWQSAAPAVWKGTIVALILSTLYLGWGMVAQSLIASDTKAQLAKQNIKGETIFANPTLGNSLLWAVLVKDGDQIHYGMRSLLDSSDEPMQFNVIERRSDLLKQLQERERAQSVMDFSKGFYGLTRVDEKIRISDLRMGYPPNFVFTFAIAQQTISDFVPLVPSKRINVTFDRSLFDFLWQRIFDAKAEPASQVMPQSATDPKPQAMSQPEKTDKSGS